MPLSNDQLGYLTVSSSGNRGWSITALGTVHELSAKGRAEFRRVWDEEPERRPYFGEGPPESWRSRCP